MKRRAATTESSEVPKRSANGTPAPSTGLCAKSILKCASHDASDEEPHSPATKKPFGPTLSKTTRDAATPTELKTCENTLRNATVGAQGVEGGSGRQEHSSVAKKERAVSFKARADCQQLPLRLDLEPMAGGVVEGFEVSAAEVKKLDLKKLKAMLEEVTMRKRKGEKFARTHLEVKSATNKANTSKKTPATLFGLPPGTKITSMDNCPGDETTLEALTELLRRAQQAKAGVEIVVSAIPPRVQPDYAPGEMPFLPTKKGSERDDNALTYPMNGHLRTTGANDSRDPTTLTAHPLYDVMAEIQRTQTMQAANTAVCARLWSEVLDAAAEKQKAAAAPTCGKAAGEQPRGGTKGGADTSSLTVAKTLGCFLLESGIRADFVAAIFAPLAHRLPSAPAQQSFASAAAKEGGAGAASSSSAAQAGAGAGPCLSAKQSGGKINAPAATAGTQESVPAKITPAVVAKWEKALPVSSSSGMKQGGGGIQGGTAKANCEGGRATPKRKSFVDQHKEAILKKEYDKANELVLALANPMAERLKVNQAAVSPWWRTTARLVGLLVV
eukprot:CAMPEP_0179006216 /NCGR_PEP_ID=MMETSP0795-20121207/14413_1 /TAXON_ID=88552 /ORGANISM="Amoebophrya sp., Strain Ameob2" /LENGTH=556 /DNA_ID=CAMNT_0020700917 /DNA_START=205 /DNA_END=1875 /DNA_ORIENTATION=+